MIHTTYRLSHSRGDECLNIRALSVYLNRTREWHEREKMNHFSWENTFVTYIPVDNGNLFI